MWTYEDTEEATFDVIVAGSKNADGGIDVVLVEPQLGENIGAAARVMANFGLSRLRLVKPRDGWPNPAAANAPHR